MSNNCYLDDFLQSAAQAFFNLVAETTLPERRGIKTFLYDEEAVDYALEHPGKWVLYLSVIVRDEDDPDEAVINFSPGVMRFRIPPDSNDIEEGVWESQDYLGYINSIDNGKYGKRAE
jgi:hypothetical protein